MRLASIARGGTAPGSRADPGAHTFVLYQGHAIDQRGAVATPEAIAEAYMPWLDEWAEVVDHDDAYASDHLHMPGAEAEIGRPARHDDEACARLAEDLRQRIGAP